MRGPARAAIAAVLVVGRVTLAAAAPRWAVAVLPSGHSFSLEVAADDASRARGYMGRETVGPREGMIFVFDDESLHSFWMKDCKTSLDMIWLDAQGHVVWIAMNRKPFPPTVLDAISAAVSVMLAGTAGLTLSFMREKSPVHSVGWGRVVERTFTGALE